jgi:hypothetical protein
MICLLLESFLPGFDDYLAIYTFSTSRVLGPGINVSAVCISVCQTLLTLCLFSN